MHHTLENNKVKNKKLESNVAHFKTLLVMKIVKFCATRINNLKNERYIIFSPLISLEFVKFKVKKYSLSVILAHEFLNRTEVSQANIHMLGNTIGAWILILDKTMLCK